MSIAAPKTLPCISAKDNPFAVQRTDAIPFDFQVTPFANIEAFANHAASFDYRGAILGKHGRGKTTLLCELHSFLCGRSTDCELVFLPREKSRQANPIENTIRRGKHGAIVLIDGLERTSLVTRQRLLQVSRSFGGFIATTHRPSRLRKLIHCRTSEQTIIAVLDSLDLNQPAIVEAANLLWSRHKGNMRSVLRDLYDLFADGILESGTG